MFQETIKDIVTQNFTNSKIKISDDALSLLKELLKILVVEMAVRSIEQAKDEGVSTVTNDQVETILSQIVS